MRPDSEVNRRYIEYFGNKYQKRLYYDDTPKPKYSEWQNQYPSTIHPDFIWKDINERAPLSMLKLARLMLYLSYNKFSTGILQRLYRSHYGDPSYNEQKFKFF